MKCWGECGMEGTIALVQAVPGGEEAMFCRYCAVTFTESNEWQIPDQTVIHASKTAILTTRNA